MAEDEAVEDDTVRRVDNMDSGREEAVAVTSVQVGTLKTLLLRVPVLLLPVQVQVRRHPAIGHAGNKVAGRSKTSTSLRPTR